MKKQGVINIELCGREVRELRYLAGRERDNMLKIKKPSKAEKMLLAYYGRILRKLAGEYRCPHCKSWVLRYKQEA